jgi:EmrB/QacA subfamily drug resistance transporter
MKLPPASPSDPTIIPPPGARQRVADTEHDHYATPLEPAAVRAIIAGIMLAMFLSALEQTIIAPALPTIGARLGDMANLSWVVGAYLLSATAVTPLFGKLSDIYGRRVILLTGVIIFVFGSVACALAPTLWALVAARAVQGIGGGGILPIAQAIIADLVSPRERPRYQTQSAVMFMIASVVGPLLGGFLTEHLHWSLIFWINLPLGTLAVVITYRALERLPRNERPHKLDWVGAALMVAASLALMLAMTWGGARYPWLSAPILWLIAGSVGLWLLFGWRIATAAEPFIPLSVLGERTVAGTALAGFFSIGAIVGLSIYLPLYLELARGATASMSGVALIAFTAGTVVGAFWAGRGLGRYKRYKRIPSVGLLVAIAALAVLAIRHDLPLGIVAMLFAFAGGGIGTMYPVTTVLMQNAVPPHQFGVATGTLNFFRLLGGTIVVAGFGAIVLGAAGGVPTLEPLHRGVVPHPGPFETDFSLVFSWVFAAACACLAAALAALAIVEERPLRGPASRQPLGQDDVRIAAEYGAGMTPPLHRRAAGGRA